MVLDESLRESNSIEKDIVSRAAEFARRAHAVDDQRRKYTGEPYIVHPERVAAIVSTVTSDEVMIAAAWLHDVVEDTSVKIDEIVAKFGAEVAEVVNSVTKVVDGKKIGREKAALINIKHAAEGSSRAQTVKLADVIDNTSDIVDHEPEFAIVYLREKKMLLELLTEGNHELHRIAEDIVRKSLAILAERGFC